MYDFSANVIVLVNHQIRRVSPLLRFISLIEGCGFCESMTSLASSLTPENTFKICEKIKNEVTNICEKALAPTPPESKQTNSSVKLNAIPNKTYGATE